ncbi:carboxypeptidase regulatory-like domain-containing protein [Flavihumibacter sp. R14]|nr:carboxypeptidase regulatory-like domain-containing protein [Flavihumibacter soli]
MKVLRSLAIAFLILLKAGFLYSQDTLSLNTIIEKTMKFTEQYPSEKVHLHFDKPYYAVGDTIWFKAYLALGQNQPSDLSKVLYVDILSDKDTIVRSLKLPVVNTSAYGSLTLDPTVYKAGNYRVRAYTQWMLNFSDSYFFYKNIRIGDALNRKVITNILIKEENGNQSPGIKVRVSFKDPQGNVLAGRRVGWQVVSNFATIAKGKETTDAQGNISLTLSSAEKAALDAGVLETILESDNSRQITSVFPLKNSFKDADIQFFPEGGELIEGVSGKIAFKAIRESGLGVAVKGEISDNTGQVVSAIESQHLGMGVFTMIAEPGKTYKASLTFANGVKKIVSLPAAKSSGIGLLASNTTADNLILRISSSPAYFAANKDRSYYLVAQSKGVICYAAKTSLNAPAFSASIPKNKFPTGIVQLTLFSASGEPLTERLVFNHQLSALNLAVSTDKKAYRTRQPVKMNVVARAGTTPVQGNFSISIVSEDKVPFSEDDESTILSSFLIASELGGYIEKPNYYFTQINDKKLKDLDILMLTQGHRKFSYKDILADKKPAVSFLPEQGIAFTGTLRTSNGMPVGKGSMRLMVPQNRFAAETLTDSKGRFEFKNVNVPDSAEVSISARNSTGARNMMIMLDGSAFPEVTKNVNAPEDVLNLDSVLAPYLENSKKQYTLASQMLQEVVISSTVLKKASHKDYAALSGLSPLADHVLEGERLKGCNTLLTCLQSSANGLTFYQDNFYVSRVYNTGLRVPVQTFVNGLPVDATYLNSVIPADVESVEIFLKDDLGTVNRTYNTNGVLVIHMKKVIKKPVTAEELKALFPPSNVLTFNPLGYLKSREFYMPKYTTAESRTLGSDLRATVYWNPKVFTDESGKMSFEFYNGDLRGSYKAIVEGTDIEGNLARFVYRYKVE